MPMTMRERGADGRRLSKILKAASDPTRRAVLTLLAQGGPARVTDIAGHFAMSLNAVSKHIKVLEDAGLVSRVTTWREHLIAAELDALGGIDRWFAALRSIWDQRLETLAATLEGEGDVAKELRLTVRRLIKAPTRRVYEAWLDPKMLARFMIPAPGVSVARARTNARVGGRFALIMRVAGRDIAHGGTYLELTPRKRIVFTWESPFSVEGSTVTITLRAVAGGTEVQLVHVKFPSAESHANHRAGWRAILKLLAATLAAPSGAARANKGKIR